MQYVAIIVLLALMQYVFFIARVGFNRAKYNVNAPKTVGDETWERLYRVQMNTAEQLIIFVPAIMIFAHHVSIKWALLPGLLFIVGRAIYSHLYIKNPASRAPGMVLSFFSNIGMVIASLIALVMEIVQGGITL